MPALPPRVLRAALWGSAARCTPPPPPAWLQQIPRALAGFPGEVCSLCSLSPLTAHSTDVNQTEATVAAPAVQQGRAGQGIEWEQGMGRCGVERDPGVAVDAAWKSFGCPEGHGSIQRLNSENRAYGRAGGGRRGRNTFVVGMERNERAHLRHKGCRQMGKRTCRKREVMGSSGSGGGAEV